MLTFKRIFTRVQMIMIILFCVQEDETIETLSRISFTPVKTDNNDRVECEAINDVMAVPIKTQATLDILCT